MRRQEGQLAVETVCRPVGNFANNWTDGVLLRVAKRSRSRCSGEYFVTALEAPYGFGAWAARDELRPLTPLELIAIQLD